MSTATKAFFNIFGPLKDNATALVENATAASLIEDPFPQEQDLTTEMPDNATVILNATTSTSDDDYWREISSLSDGQEQALSLLQVTSGFLSLLGSCVILHQVWNSTKHRRTSYGRILVGLSVADIIASTSFALAPFLLPQDTSQRVWASGNDQTCSFLGFWSQLAYLAPWYNGILGFYYYLTIRCGVPRGVFAQQYEVWIHVGSWIFFVTSATVGASLGIYSESELGQGCWVGK